MQFQNCRVNHALQPDIYALPWSSIVATMSHKMAAITVVIAVSATPTPSWPQYKYSAA